MARLPASPLRLCVISHSCVVAANQVPWATMARDHPVDITILAPRTWRDTTGRPLTLGTWEGLEGRVRPMCVLPRGHPNLHFWLGLRRALRETSPHVIFLDEEPYSLAAAQILTAPSFGGAALVVYAKQNIFKRIPPPLSWVERTILRKADALVAVDSGAREVLESKGARGPIAVIPHCIEPGLYEPGPSCQVRSELGLSGFVIGYVGRLVPEKGVQDLLQAVASLATRTAHDFSVLIVGDGPERERLRAYADRALPGRVLFVGSVPHIDVPRYYRCMDVLVLPSRTAKHWREQFGRTLIEAQACGVPVIGSDSGAIPTTIAMTAGLVYPEGNPEALASRLLGLISDPARRRELAQLGRQRVLERFSDSAVAQALYEVCVEAFHRSQAKRSAS